MIVVEDPLDFEAIMRVPGILYDLRGRVPQLVHLKSSLSRVYLEGEAPKYSVGCIIYYLSICGPVAKFSRATILIVE